MGDAENSDYNSLLTEVTAIRTIIETSDFQKQINKVDDKFSETQRQVIALNAKFNLIAVLLPFLLGLASMAFNHFIAVSPITAEMRILANKIQTIEIKLGYLNGVQ